MIYALNVYDIIPGKEAIYASYVESIAPLIKNFDMAIAAAGQNPIREISGRTRNHFALVQFADLENFDGFMAALEKNDFHRLREQSTENYLWTIYEAWGFDK
jgi:antibiotic biosynthesis monooxygenase (ABM) superfamily enzyme